MSYIEKIINVCENLNENELKELYNFAKSLELKKEQELKKIMNESIEKNIVALRELAKCDEN